MTATVNPEDRALHAKMLIQGAVDELARWMDLPDQAEARTAALGASLHYLFEIAAERYGEDGVRFLGNLVPSYVCHALTGELPEDEEP
ncbi:MAG TPA: hypothetical protein VL752_09775 [Acidisoma sp.]|jgi:hypothetical protein|uniref:hypothetical protein n=1 Tax=Acidisoma sp. TaxID=1872115 RepID=UPI002C6AC05A|nr:hypothetical protein [Acidisoma sp.]HTI01219.1 hypothetical protein [Acidisoma sp.]